MCRCGLPTSAVLLSYGMPWPFPVYTLRHTDDRKAGILGLNQGQLPLLLLHHNFEVSQHFEKYNDATHLHGANAVATSVPQI